MEGINLRSKATGNISVLKLNITCSLFILEKDIYFTYETRKLMNEYMKDWRAKNKGKVK